MNEYPENPMVRKHGPGPKSETCGHCDFLRPPGILRDFEECVLRTPSSEWQEQHFAIWPACKLFSSVLGPDNRDTLSDLCDEMDRGSSKR